MITRHFAKYLKLSVTRAREGHLPVARQLLEMAYLLIRYRLGPGFYHRARFWRRDMPFREKTRYRLGQPYLDAVAKINHPRYETVSQNKICEKAMLALFAIPTAPFLGCFHDQTGRTVDGMPLCSGDDLLALLERRQLHSAAIKRPVGARGIGFDLIDVSSFEQREIFSRALQQKMPVDEYLRMKTEEYGDQGIHIEGYIEQHPAMAALNPSSVNTMRLWVRQTKQGIQVRSGVLKVGSRNSLADYNLERAGGLCAPINLENGTLREIHVRPGPESERVDPNVLKGFTIPFWDETLVLAKQCLAVFPETRLAGMDIAITVSGPCIVELNNQPDPVHAANVDIPTLDLIGEDWDQPQS
ncbi:MAG: sugar-transfer associated ATP-grasp domain-containing protein [Pseudomonadales bacterium]